MNATFRRRARLCMHMQSMTMQRSEMTWVFSVKNMLGKYKNRTEEENRKSSRVTERPLCSRLSLTAAAQAGSHISGLPFVPA